jgi:hypothetical protein
MSPQVPVAGGPRLTPAADNTLLAVAVALMIAGVVMIFTDVSAGIAIPAIAVGIGITAIVQVDKRRSRER